MLLACSALLVASGPAFGFCRLRAEDAAGRAASAGKDCSQDGVLLKWGQRCLSYSVVRRERKGADFERVRDAIARGFETWNQVRCEQRPVGLDIIQTQQLSLCGDPEYNSSDLNVHSIMFVDDWAARDLPEAAFGLTLVWHDRNTGEILDADMQLNETKGALTPCGVACDADQIDIQNLVTHEAGHFLGLDHSSLIDASMYREAATGEVAKRHLHKDDVAGLCSIYGDEPAPQCARIDYSPRNGLSLHCAREDDGGCSALPGLGTRSPVQLTSLLLLGLVLLGRRRAIRA